MSAQLIEAQPTAAMDAEIEFLALSAWNTSEYGYSQTDTVHPMFLSAFFYGYRAGESAQPVAVPHEAIGMLLADAMDTAVKNGANSISMPDHLVEIAAWLAAAPAAPALVPLTAKEKRDADRWRKAVAFYEQGVVQGYDGRTGQHLGYISLFLEALRDDGITGESA